LKKLFFNFRNLPWNLRMMMSTLFVTLSLAQWEGPFTQMYTDQDCPNMGCFGFDLAGCESQCDRTPGCNAMNFGASVGKGCCLRGCVGTKLSTPTGTLAGNVSYRKGATPPAPAPAPIPNQDTQCEGQRPAWGDVSVCLYNAGSGTWYYHCPWESGALVATKRFGGCPLAHYGCKSINVPALLNLYTNAVKTKNTPDNTVVGIQYDMCCVRHQCLGGPACGAPPNPAAVMESTSNMEARLSVE